MKWFIEGQKSIYSHKANEWFKISCKSLGLHSGTYTFIGICENDTVKQKFSLLNYDDKKLSSNEDIWLMADHKTFSSQKDVIRLQYGTTRKMSLSFIL